MQGRSPELHRSLSAGRDLGGEPWDYTGPRASFGRFERFQDGQARGRKDREWSKEFEKN